MKIPSELIKIGFNKRSLTYEDFEELCKILGILLFCGKSESKGIHFFRRGYPIIWLSDKLKEPERSFVAWHELAHFLLHDPSLRYFVDSTIRKIENEANVLSACCLISLPQLKKILRCKEDHDYPVKIFKFRCEVFLRYGL